MAQDCIFCKIATGVIKTPLLHEDADAVAFRDINPQAPAHLLVVPKRHFQDLPDLFDQGEGRLVEHLVAVATRLARSEGLLPDGFRLVANSGPHAGQTVPHVHFHVLGGRHMGWPPG